MTEKELLELSLEPGDRASARGILMEQEGQFGLLLVPDKLDYIAESVTLNRVATAQKNGSLTDELAMPKPVA